MLFEKISEKKVEELSKKIETFFAYNKDIDKTAYMNWRFSFDRSFASQFSTLADGFFESSIKAQVFTITTSAVSASFTRI